MGSIRDVILRHRLLATGVAVVAAMLVGEAIRRIHTGQSVGALFDE
jgi:phosphoribosylpyrophosphate synthetase